MLVNIYHGNQIAFRGLFFRLYDIHHTISAKEFKCSEKTEGLEIVQGYFSSPIIFTFESASSKEIKCSMYVD